MMPVLIIAAGAVLMALVVMALLYPRLALLLLVALDVSRINAVVASHVGISPYLPLLMLAVVAVGVMIRRRMFTFSWSPVLLGLLVVFAGFCLSLRDVADPLTSEGLLEAYLRDLVFFLAVYALVLSTRDICSVIQSAVLVLAGLAVLTVYHEFVLHNAGTLGGLSQVPLTEEAGAFKPRHAGTHDDVNFWARLLIMFTPLSLSLFALSRSALPRLLWASSAVALLLGIYLTQSRGGFIAVFVCLIVWAVLAGARYRKTLLWFLLGLALLIPLSGVGTRLATLAMLGTSGTANADVSLVTRERLQWVAWRMFLDAPVTGHGIGSYGSLFRFYDRLSNYYSPVNLGAAAHNFFLEQAADGGVLLLLAWAIFFGTILFVALRTLVISRKMDNRYSRYLSTGVIGGIIGWLVASVFLHLSDFRALLLLAAVAGALDVHARQELQALPEEPVVAGTTSGTSHFRGYVAVSVVSLTALVVVLVTGGERYSHTTTLAVAPVSAEADWSRAYKIDVLSRGTIVPTIATVLDNSISVADLQRRTGNIHDPTRTSVDFRPSRLGGSITVAVTADEEQVASDFGGAAVALARAEIVDLASGYRLTGTTSVLTALPSYRMWAAVPLTLIVILSVTGAVLTMRRRTDSNPVPVAATYPPNDM